MKKIAFLGMGTMGKFMASNLQSSKKFGVIKVWNRNPFSEGIKYVAQSGVETCITIHNTVKDADIVCICVSDCRSVKEVLFSEDGAIHFMKENKIILDFSTISFKSSIFISDKLKDYRINYFDTPVSGGDVGAKNGTLTIMVGGKEEELKYCSEIFNVLGKNIFYGTNIGDGQKLKSVNQILCGINMISICEALKYAELNNIPLDLVIKACSTGAGSSWALQNLGPKIENDEYKTGFLSKHMIKDLRIVNESIPDNINFEGIELAIKKFMNISNLDIVDKDLATQAMFLTY
jgi:3-hydroxyisobutyrate dehydrogenase